jgi:hypothetical protein
MAEAALVQIYGFRSEPRDTDLGALFDAARIWCSTLLLVVRPNLGLSEYGRGLLERLQPYRLDVRESRAWPGTELLDGFAVVYRFKLTREVVEAVLQASASLFLWQQPELPEDPCLLRPDGSEWLVTIAHEEDAYLSLTDDEVQLLHAESPTIAALLTQEPAEPDKNLGPGD